MKLFEAWLWGAIIVVFCSVLTHYGRKWRGAAVPSFADYVDYCGLGCIVVIVAIVAGLFDPKPYTTTGPQMLAETIGRFLIFVLKAVVLLFIVGLLTHWLRGRMSLGRRATLYGVLVCVSTAGLVLAKSVGR